MRQKTNKPSHVSTAETLWEDLGFSREEAAVMEVKLLLHGEIMKEVQKQKLTPKALARLLDIQQPHASNLLGGKITSMSVDRLTKYLHRLGRTVHVTTKKSRKLEGAEVA